MEPIKLLQPLQPKKIKKFYQRHRLFLLIGVVVLALIIWSFTASDAAVFNYVFKGTSLQTEDGRVNILLLGIAGGKHDGATLTDTIMLISYDLKSHQVDLISIPRDLWIEKYKAKINTFYQTGLLKGEGLRFTEDEISKLLDIKIPYGIRIDFTGFTKAIDLVDGVDIEVKNSFDDYTYPIEGREEDLCGYQESELDVTKEKSLLLGIPEGKQKVFTSSDGKIATSSANLDFSCRFEHIHFDKGTTHMDGTTALKFARSRHGNHDEGSDFARSKRQQQVLEAFRSKVLSATTLLDIGKITSLAQTFGDSVSSDIPRSKYLELLTFVKKVDSVKSHVLDNEGTQPVLIHPDPAGYGGAWVVIPPGNDFSSIQHYIDDIVAGQTSSGSAVNR